VIAVKGNKRFLLMDIKTLLQQKANIDSAYTQMEVNRGRVELRTTKVSAAVAAVRGEWVGLRQVIEVERLVISKGKQRREWHYYISSHKANALFYAEGIRLHWHIENALHYVRDVTLKEDQSKIRCGFAPQNLSTLRNIALNLLRTANDGYQSVASKIRLVAYNIKKLKQLIL
jgi:predicted transposase YbfD/YdcC